MTTAANKGLLAAFFSLVLVACAGLPGTPAGVKLSGEQEVPPVTTAATGIARITVAADGSIAGSITTSGVDATMAHVHIGAAGKNGPVIVPMSKSGEGVWVIAPGAKLTAEQLKAYQAGELYVNVHSAANKGGEIRAQLKP